MDRREFLSQVGMLAGGSLLATRLDSSHDPETGWQVDKEPKFHCCLWSGLSPKSSDKELKEKYGGLRKKGVTRLYVSGYEKREFEAIREAGIEAQVWMWTTNRGDQWIRDNHPGWYMVSRTGKSCFDAPPYVDYYRWVSPVIPGVQDYITDKALELAVKPEVNGVHLDYVRFPDVILPRALWRQYGVDQTEELPEYDFCYGEHSRRAFMEFHGRDPLEIKDPAHDQQWLHFRYDSVTRLVRRITKEVRKEGKEVTAAVFPTPRLARKICRQSWSDWPLDAACPMVYHSFYDEKVDWIGECTLENVRSVKFPVINGLYMPALGDITEFKRALQVSQERGARGWSLFGGVSDAHWDVVGAALAKHLD